MNQEEIVDAYRDRAIHQLAEVAWERSQIHGSELPIDKGELDERIQKQIEIEAKQKEAAEAAKEHGSSPQLELDELEEIASRD